MRAIFHKSDENLFIGKITLILFTIFLIFIVINHLCLRNIYITITTNYLKRVSNNIDKDIDIKKNNLNVIKYFQNTNLPFDIPIYIITREGYVIERMNFIRGFLDTASFEYSKSFGKPTTILTPGAVKWRVYSRPIVRNNIEEGSVVVAYYDPKESAIQDIDEQLISNANKINSWVVLKNNKLDVNAVKSSNIDYDVYYQIVDRFNKILIDEGSPPSYMDRSYIANYLYKNGTTERFIDHNGNQYMLYITTIGLDEPSTVVIVGKSTNEFETLIGKQQKYMLGTSLLLLTLTLLVFIYLKKELSSIVEDRTTKSLKRLTSPKYLDPYKIYFNEKTSYIYFDDTKVKIEYATKQFDFCRVLFQNPNKRWENDELQTKLGFNDEDLHERTFYDLKEIINKKTQGILGQKLIFYENKTYYINPNLATRINKKTTPR